MSSIMHSEWRGRIRHWIRILKNDFYTPLGEISWEAFRTMDQLTPDEAKQQAFTPVAPGFTWGNTYEYCWMRGKVTLPEKARGERKVSVEQELMNDMMSLTASFSGRLYGMRSGKNKVDKGNLRNVLL